MTSPRLSDWKSQGETKTTSPSRIQTRRFILPRIRQSLSRPSWQRTRTRSNPKSLTAMPRTSLATGSTKSLIFSSLIIFFLPTRLNLNYESLFPYICLSQKSSKKKREDIRAEGFPLTDLDPGSIRS